MKRTATGYPVAIDWRYCFICQRKHKNDITNSDSTRKTVADNITEYRNLGQLELSWTRITEVVDEEGNCSQAASLYDSLTLNNACFHRACGSRYNKQKLQRLTTKQKETEQQSSSSSRSTRSSVDKNDFGSYFCTICNKPDVLKNLHARGSHHANEEKVNAHHTNDSIETWRSMALKTGNESLLINLSSSGDATSNEFYYHGHCNHDLWNDTIRLTA